MKERKSSKGKSMKLLDEKDTAQIKGGLLWYTGGDGGPPPYEPKGKKDKKNSYTSPSVFILRKR